MEEVELSEQDKAEERAVAEIHQMQEREQMFMELKPEGWTWEKWVKCLKDFKQGKSTFLGENS